MSRDPLEKLLTGLSPKAASLDRDALLFAAGQASAPPRRGWAVLAGVLAATQVLTLMTWVPPAFSRRDGLAARPTPAARAAQAAHPAPLEPAPPEFRLSRQALLPEAEKPILEARSVETLTALGLRQGLRFTSAADFE